MAERPRELGDFKGVGHFRLRYRNAANHASPYGPLRPNVTSSIKPEIHNISQSCQRRIEPRPQRIRLQSFVRIGLAVPEICSQTDRQTHRQTHRQTDRNTPLPYPGGVTNGVPYTSQRDRSYDMLRSYSTYTIGGVLHYSYPLSWEL